MVTAYDDREDLAGHIVRVLREDLHHLLAAGVALVQFDEPVLTEVVYGTPGAGGRTFMCGAWASGAAWARSWTSPVAFCRN